MTDLRAPRRHLVFLTAASLTLLAGCLPAPSVHTRRKGDDIVRRLNVPRTRIDGLLLGTALEPDQIRAIDAPRFHAPGEDTPYRANARVLGLVRAGEARAYPLRVLNRHELVNDVVAGEPVAIAWCPILQGGKGFVRVLGGEPVLLGISGKLWGNGLVAFDRPSGSLFTLWDGHALRGRWRGASLESFELELTTLARWRRAHPETLVMALPDPAPGIHPRYRDRLGLALALHPKFLPPPERLRRLHHLPAPEDTTTRGRTSP